MLATSKRPPSVANATNMLCMPSIPPMPRILAAVIRRGAITCEFRKGTSASGAAGKLRFSYTPQRPEPRGCG